MKSLFNISSVLSTAVSGLLVGWSPVIRADIVKLPAHLEAFERIYEIASEGTGFVYVIEGDVYRISDGVRNEINEYVHQNKDRLIGQGGPLVQEIEYTYRDEVGAVFSADRSSLRTLALSPSVIRDVSKIPVSIDTPGGGGVPMWLLAGEYQLNMLNAPELPFEALNNIEIFVGKLKAADPSSIDKMYLDGFWERQNPMLCLRNIIDNRMRGYSNKLGRLKLLLNKNFKAGVADSSYFGLDLKSVFLEGDTWAGSIVFPDNNQAKWVKSGDNVSGVHVDSINDTSAYVYFLQNKIKLGLFPEAKLSLKPDSIVLASLNEFSDLLPKNREHLTAQEIIRHAELVIGDLKELSSLLAAGLTGDDLALALNENYTRNFATFNSILPEKLFLSLVEMHLVRSVVSPESK